MSADVLEATALPLCRVVLYSPEKAGNVGNVARTCAVLGAELHLIRPYGFHLQDREFARAVMDYLEGVTLIEHDSWTALQATLTPEARVWAFSTHASQLYTDAEYQRGDYLLFGPESRGLPVWLRGALPSLKLPQPGGGRSLNLAVAAGAAAFEVQRQLG
ncbi:tRNA (cytidine(34)-2'-O)-methyltransferase [Deinococcus rubellus]|uniref:Putative tRNA (cytidine(34)-2'-O)-methyltransferase n=1 Tax=Deinococcus rubellus TaxID=1889240 RepID=A0ABY5YHC6_9DEIO|nr:tRNA (cytidine(34)-2'-O)-methyltransferase [Deinococcus rubellus]UWX64488.1 tRNA (cytidine(34)-2'-O)-methyltransferase [Deinococcus rubellus]